MYVYVDQYRRTATGAVKVQTRHLELSRVVTDSKEIPLAVIRFPMHGEVNFNVNHQWAEDRGMELWKISDESIGIVRDRCEDRKIRFFVQERLPLAQAGSWRVV